MTELASADAPAGPVFPHRSFWSEDYGPYAPSEPLRGELTADVVIIGAGYTGLSTAINLRQADAACKVVVLEQEAVGYGASGRNSGWVWPYLTGFEDILSKHGVDTLRETYTYAKRAYQYVGELVNEHKLDSDYRETGLLRPSVSEEYEPDRYKYVEFAEKMGRSDQISEMSQQAVQEEYGSPLFYKALWDKELALIHPVKHARSLAGLARSLGAEIYEQTPAIHLSEMADGVLISTPTGKIKADRVVLATNGYTHLLKGLEKDAISRQQRPIFAYNTVSRPLTEQEWVELKWKKRNAIYSFGPASHFGSPTADGRIHWCSDRFVGVPYGSDMSMEYVHNYNATLKAQTGLFFPAIKDIELSHHWGGPVGITIDRINHLGYLNKGQRILLSVGCNGNGVSTAHLNGKIVAELLTGQKSELSDLWFVNRNFRKWPSTHFATLALRSVLGFGRWKSARRASRAGLGDLIQEVDK